MIEFDIAGFLSDIYRSMWEWLDKPGLPPKDRSNDPEVEESFARLLERNSRFSDPVYKKNVQELIERNKRFEKPE